MKRTQQISLGFTSYFKAFEFIFRNGLWIYFFYPVIIAILLFFGGIALADYLSDLLTTFIYDYFGLGDPDSWFLAALGWLMSFFIKYITFVIFFYIKGSVLKYITLILLSPVMAHLSQRTDQIITGIKTRFDSQQFVKNILRGIGIALRNMLIEFLFIFIFFFVSFIPVIGWLVSLVVLSLVSWFFYGFSMIDYSSERKKLSIGESTSFCRKNKWLCITNGSLFWIIFSIPWIGVIFAPVFGIVSATLAVNEIKENNE